MPKADHERYRGLIRSLISRLGYDEAMKMAPGGQFEKFGILERELLIQHGLKPDDYLIDVGCGSGRLALPLTEYLTGRYLGTDIVPELVQHARRLAGNRSWRFELTEANEIPEKDGQADMVCFFSVFTHLLHEESYLYLKAATRVLKPNGKIVFSFLEFDRNNHWPIFEGAIQTLGQPNTPLTMFVGRDAIRAWASHLNLRIDALVGGDEPHIKLPRKFKLESGGVLEGLSSFGQSVCVLTKMF